MKITDEFIGAVENRLGCGHKAWDLIDPKLVARAIIEQVEETQQRAVDWSVAEWLIEQPRVDEALRNFADDQTASNAAGLVQAILETAPSVPGEPAPKADQSGDATEMVPKSEQHEPALLLWRAICEEAECVVLPGSAGGKRLMLTEEMCQRLGAAIESTPPDLAAENARLREEWKRECDDADKLLAMLGIAQSVARTDGGSLNLPKLREIIGVRQAAEQMQQKRIAELAAALAGKDLLLLRIASTTQTNDLLWWQIDARAALALQPHASIVAKIKAEGARSILYRSIERAGYKEQWSFDRDEILDHADRIEREGK